MTKSLKLAAACSAVLIVTACSSGGGSNSQAFHPTVATEAPAGSGDVETITWNVGTGEPTTLDPALSALESISTIDANLCEGMTRWDGDYNQEPALATSIDHPDDTTWVFHLRKDVTFWDGTPMTAADVAYSIERVLEPKLGSSWVGWAPEGAEITATDDHTVSVTVPSYVSTIEQYFAAPAFAVVSKSFAEEAGTQFGSPGTGVMCTGPYKVDEWKSGESLTITRNDSWWDAENAPKVKDVKFTFVTDPAAQTAGLVSGDIDGQFNVGVGSYQQLEKTNGNLLFGTSMSPLFLAVIDTTGALKDVEAREALRNAIDYEGIVKSVYHEAASPLRALVPPAAYGYGKDVYEEGYDDLPEPVQDVETAKSLASSSSAGKDKIVLAYSTANAEETKTATAIADAANSAGLEVELKPLGGTDYNQLFSSPEARKGIDTFLVAGYLDFPDPVTYYDFFTIGSYYNFGGYENQAYTDRIDDALAEPDPDAKAGDVVAAQQIMMEELPTIPILTPYVSVYYAQELGGLVPRQNYLYTPWAASLGGAES